MTQPAKVQEPSMEEILASIRRIIADDEAKPGSGEKSAGPAAPAPTPEKPAPAAKAAPKAPPPALAAARPAVVPPKPPAAASPAPAVTNSQDDIDAMLASLDEATPAAEVRPSLAPSQRKPEETEVFDLTDEMVVPETPPPPAPSFQKVEPEDDIEFAEVAAPPPPPQPDPEPRSMESIPVPPILSRSTMNAVESAFNSLANTVLSNNARTLEDLVREMLRPMLKSWLDDNLPGLVERIVKSEIERVSRGR
jgi:uncharacterized protein